MKLYALNVKSKNARFPKTLEMLGLENYSDEFSFESEYFCDIEEKADCLIEMEIDFQFEILPEEWPAASTIKYDKSGYLAYKKAYNEGV